MNGYTTSTYGDRIAGVYDQVHSTRHVSGCVEIVEEIVSKERAPQHD